MEEHAGVIGDWLVSPRRSSVLSSMMMGVDDDEEEHPHPHPHVKSIGLVERIAARAGFNAPRLNTQSIFPSPGLSPTTLLDSPVFLSNSLVHPSPTTGKFPFAQNTNTRTSIFDYATCSSFTFNPTHTHTTPPTASQQSFPTVEVSVQSDNSATIVADLSTEKHPVVDDDDDDEDNVYQGVITSAASLSEDGYNWRKYGQKQVKGSEYPRSYYKCTHLNCPVKKKVERSHEGHITEIIYKGAHNHPKPQPNHRAPLGVGASQQDVQQIDADADAIWSTSIQKVIDSRHDNLEVSSSASAGSEYCNPSSSLQGLNGKHIESSDGVDASRTFSNDEDEDDRGTHGSASLGYDGEGDESESKRRKTEAYTTEMSGATRAIREPRVVVQTTSEVDILDDGYRWRKYGQKVVKGNPNPRSYYKCTNVGCTVRKHVERASHDLKSVITTYEGKHNHDVPAARNTSGTLAAAAAAAHRPDPSQLHNNSTSMPRFERPPPTYGRRQQQQMGASSYGFPYGMSQNQPNLANLAMAGFGVHPYSINDNNNSNIGGGGQVNEMGFMVPKGEPKFEPLSEAGNGSSYQQVMSRLPLGPHL